MTLNFMSLISPQQFLSSISAHIEHHKAQNVKEPLKIDITTPVQKWQGGQFSSDSRDLIVNINMIHISPWTTAVVS